MKMREGSWRTRQRSASSIFRSSTTRRDGAAGRDRLSGGRAPGRRLRSRSARAPGQSLPPSATSSATRMRPPRRGRRWGRRTLASAKGRLRSIVLKNSGERSRCRFRRKLKKIGLNKINDLQEPDPRKTGVQTSKSAASGVFQHYRSIADMTACEIGSLLA